MDWVRAVVFAGLAFGVGCSTAGSIGVVQSEYWKNEDFSSYKRYAWLPSDPQQRSATQPEEHRLHQLIRDALDKQLIARGFIKTNGGDEDFLVTFHCKVAKVVESRVINRVWYQEVDDSPYFEEVTPRVELSMSEFERGSIVIDFATPGRPKGGWRGIGRGGVPPAAPSAGLGEIVDEAVSEILDEFPPPSDG